MSRTHGHGGEGKDGVHGNVGRKDKQAHKRCIHPERKGRDRKFLLRLIHSSCSEKKAEGSLTGDEDDEPDGVDGDFVLGEASKEATVGDALVAREGVKRTSVGMRRGSDDLFPV